MQPVGPESPGTYWMRRAVLVVGVLVVLLLGLKACGGSSGDAAERKGATPTLSPAASSGPSATPSAGAGATEGPGDGAASDASAGDVVLDLGAVTASPTAGVESTAGPTGAADDAPATGSACADSDLDVSAKADAESYGSGANPTLTLTVRNVSGEACTRDLGSAALELVVTSGPARIWSSDDCGAKSGHAERTLKAGESWSTDLTWSRKRSGPGCTGRADASDGTYAVSARVGTAESDSDRFLLK